MTLENLYRADKIIFEVNARTPMVWGENALPVSMADVLYEVDEPSTNPRSPHRGEGGDHRRLRHRDDEGWGLHPAGFGGIPNAIGFHLMESMTWASTPSRSAPLWPISWPAGR